MRGILYDRRMVRGADSICSTGERNVIWEIQNA